MMRDGGAARRDGSAARALARLLTPAGAAVLAFAAVAATGTRPAATDGWRLLPAAPAAPNAAATAVWTGSEIVLFGRRESRDAAGAVLRRVAVADAYDPVTGGWRRLAPPAATASFAGYASVWTGRQVIVWGQGTRLAFDPRLGTWRRLARSRLLTNGSSP